ncbi:MAG TPA: Uma2 family endonuclease [Pyrinomonadaceae bacterium]|jgi:Uma2 family endonuclease|nr:Uma2 family endonuclease [Pyrinomonadaceae bacterium]
MPSQRETLLTLEEYLAIERKSEIKHEYFAGEMFAMVGASKRHNLITANIIRILGNQLLARPCNVYPSDMRVKVSATGKYTYPDVVVACDEEEYDDVEKDTLLNPVIIIEVLLESTEAYDRGKKFKQYQAIQSLTEYLLVAQEQYRIEQYVRQSNSEWRYTEYHNAEDVIKISVIGCELVLKDVYTKVA